MLVSYAQNFEDVMLWRALKGVSGGVYIDIGAQDPNVDSVSRMFYDHGWRGVHIEATATYAQRLRDARPDEIVIQAAIAKDAGVMGFYEIVDTGISTGVLEIAESHKARGFEVREIVIPTIPLSGIFEQLNKDEIHWLKIDVEGMETDVLESWNKHKARPWIVVVESVLPLSRVDSYEPWEYLLLDLDYRFAYFDGLNRYYVSSHKSELIDLFDSGPNLFDDFSISGTASEPFSVVLKQEINTLKHVVATSRQEFEETLNHRNAAYGAAMADLEGRKGELEAQLNESRQFVERLQQAAFIERSNKDHAVSATTVALNTELRQLEKEWRQREQDNVAALAALQQAFNSAQTSITAEYSRREDALNEQLSIMRSRLIERETLIGEKVEEFSVYRLAKTEETARLHYEHARTQDILNRTHADLTAVQAQLHQTHADVVTIREQLYNEQMALKLLQHEYSALDAERRELHARVDTERVEFAGKLASLTDELATLNTLIIDNETAYKLVEADLRQDMQTRIDAAEVQHAELVNRLAIRDEDIRRLEAESQAMQESHRLIEVSWHEAVQRHVSEAVAERTVSAGKIAELESALSATHAEARRQSDAQQRILSDIQTDFAAQVTAMRNSHSWKITAPLRAIKIFLSGKEIDMPVPTAQKPVVSIVSEGRVSYEPQPDNTRAGSLSDLLALHDEAFVKCVYHTLLNRDPDPEGGAHYLSRLRSGESKPRLIWDISQSAEGRAHKVRLPGLITKRSLLSRLGSPVWRIWARLSGLEAVTRQARIVENERGRKLETARASLRELQIRVAKAESDYAQKISNS